MKSNERRQYRIRPASATDLSVAIKTEECLIPGDVVDLSAGGIGVLFEPDLDPCYHVGETLHVRLTSQHLSDYLAAPCRVSHVEEIEDGRVYGFEFVDSLGLLSCLPRELARLFNKRHALRVEPDPVNPIEVKVEGTNPAFEIKAYLRDFSTEGLSFRAPALAEFAMSTTKVVKVTFRLPGSRDALTFWSRIRHRSLVGDNICYGTFFDAERTQYFEEKQRTVAAHIMDVRNKAFGLLVRQQ